MYVIFVADKDAGADADAVIGGEDNTCLFGTAVKEVPIVFS